MSLRQKLTKIITDNYTTTDSDNGYRIICNSYSEIIITLHTATGRYNFNLEIDNIGTGNVIIGTQIIKQYTHAHVGNNNGESWVVVIGAGVMTKSEIESILTGQITSHSHPESNFLDLKDTPNTYVANKIVKVNSAGNALEFADSTSWANGSFDYGKIADFVDIFYDYGGLV